MKSLAIVALLLAAASAEPGAVFAPYAPYAYHHTPAFYNYFGGFPSYHGAYASAVPYSTGYAYSTVGAPALAPAPVVKAAYVAPAAVAPVAVAAPAFYAASHQYRNQDDFGNYAFGYSGDTSSKQETRTADGVVRGSYSYLDANNQIQSRSYIADALGFREVGTNVNGGAAPGAGHTFHPDETVAYHAPAVAVHAAPAVAVHPAPAAVAYHAAPVAVAVEGPAYVPVEGVDVPFKTPEVKAAEAEHFAAVAEAQARHKREADPSGHKKHGSYAVIRTPVVVHKPVYKPVRSYAKKSHGYAKLWKREADPEPKYKKIAHVYHPKRVQHKVYVPRQPKYVKKVHKKW